jgi:hypothetical protein
MWSKNRDLRSVLFVIAVFLILILIAGGADTWAAPGRQYGTVPTRSHQTPAVSPNPLATSPNPPPGGPGAPPSGPGSSDGSANPPAAGLTPSSGSPFICAVGGGGLDCTSPAGDFTFSFPLYSVPVGTLASIVPVANCPPPIIPPEYTFLGPCYDLTVIGPDGKPITVFTPPLNLSVSYTDADVAQAGGDPNRLYILYYDVPSGLWTIGGLTDRNVDTTKHLVSVTVPHLTTYALFFQNGASAGSGGGLNTFFNSLLTLLRRLTRSEQ